ncbi:MAG TPA: S1C family serine protease [Candidatus Methylomirabilis sp.]|jgi:S1-C subfamily serine protease|nr:S1C family serine protease [Candidatus Methylomirabilis sp.]
MDAPPDLIQDVLPGTVAVAVRIREGHRSIPILGEERMGSGAVVDGRGYILTVNYLVLGAEEITVGLTDGRTVEAGVAAQDYDSGLALLRVEEAGLLALRMGSSLDLTLGDPVFAVGSTGQAERRGSGGLVTYLGEFDAEWEYMLDRAIVSTAENPGYGGGPLFDSRGLMVGSVSLTLEGVGQASLAIPVEAYRLHRLELLEHGGIVSRPHRAWLGCYVRGDEGEVLISGLVPGGPAEVGGLKPGDRIREVGFCSVSGRRDLYEELWKYRAGEQVTLTIRREEERLKVSLRSGEREVFFR